MHKNVNLGSQGGLHSSSDLWTGFHRIEEEVEEQSLKSGGTLEEQRQSSKLQPQCTEEIVHKAGT